jgi:MFS family permease
MADAMEVSLLSFMSSCAGKEFGLSNAQTASITGVVFFGELVGSLFWGPISDTFGRRFAFVVACILITSGGALSAFSPSYQVLLITRAVVGFGVGGLTVPFDLLAEFLPSSHRGAFLIYVEYFWTLGSLFVAGAAWLLLKDYGWRALAFFTVIPVGISSIFSLVLLPESPRWLLLKGDVAGAEAVIKNAAEIGGKPLQPFTLFVPATATHREEPGTQRRWPWNWASAFLEDYWGLVSTSEMRGLSFPLWTVWLSFGFCYYGIILLVSRVYSKGASSESSAAVEFDFPSIFVSASSELVGVTITALLVDRWGRVGTQSLMYFLTGAALIILSMRDSLRFSVLAIASFGFVSRMSAMSSSSATWVATPELYSTEHRGTGHAVCSAAARVGAFFSPYFVVSALSIELIALSLGGISVLTALVVWFLPETAGDFLDNLTVSSVKEQTERRESIRPNVPAMRDLAHSHERTQRSSAPSFSHHMYGDALEVEPEAPEEGDALVAWDI